MLSLRAVAARCRCALSLRAVAARCRCPLELPALGVGLWEGMQVYGAGGRAGILVGTPRGWMGMLPIGVLPIGACGAVRACTRVCSASVRPCMRPSVHVCVGVRMLTHTHKRLCMHVTSRLGLQPGQMRAPVVCVHACVWNISTRVRSHLTNKEQTEEALHPRQSATSQVSASPSPPRLSSSILRKCVLFVLRKRVLFMLEEVGVFQTRFIENCF